MMLKVRAFAPAIVLLFGCALVWQTRAQRKVALGAPLTTMLPVVPGYKVQDVQVPPGERAVAGMSDYALRVYSRDSVPQFSTLVSYYERQTQGSTIHSPRNCLPGAGWEIMRGGTRTLQVDGRTQTVNQYILKNGNATAVAYYWYQGRGRVAANEYRVKWDLLRDATFLGHTEEALVRVVVPAYPEGKSPADAERAFAAASTLGDAIAAKLMHDVSRVLPGRTAGPSA